MQEVVHVEHSLQCSSSFGCSIEVTLHHIHIISMLLLTESFEKLHFQEAAEEVSAAFDEGACVKSSGCHTYVVGEMSYGM